MKTKIKIGEKTYQIEISESDDNLLKVRVDNKDHFFTKNELGEVILVDPGSKNFGLETESKDVEILRETLAKKEIRAPLAGIISSINVGENEEVKSGQKVATLIAMKMENEIISESYGRVKEIKVKKNQSVNTDDVLLILE